MRLNPVAALTALSLLANWPLIGAAMTGGDLPVAGGDAPVAGGNAPVAFAGGQAIGAPELSARTSAKLQVEDESYELHLRQLKFSHDAARELYIEQELQELIDQRVLALEAASKKASAADLTKAIKTPDVSDAEMHQFYDANRDNIRKPYEAVAGKIKEYLQKQAADTAQRRYLDSLRTKYHASAVLEPPRMAVSASGPQRGPVDAPVTIVEFSDFQCPFCGEFEPIVRGTLAKYGARVRLVYRHLPLTSLHKFAQKAAEAAVCAQRQEKFWEMHDLMFAEQSSLGVEQLKDKARRIGLDGARFDDCLDGGQAAPAVQGDVTAAEALGLSGTPSTFVNGRYIRNGISAEGLWAIVDDELRRNTLTARR
jgi:protein-disulfide isomerase